MTGGRPSVVREPRIEGLALIETDRGDRRHRRAPLEGHPVVGAVSRGDLELREQRDVRSVDVPHPAVESDVTAVPAVGQPGADHVLAAAQRRRHIVRLIAEAVAVARPPGGEHVVTDAFAVDLELVDAVGGRVDPRSDDAIGQGAFCDHRTHQVGRAGRIAGGFNGGRHEVDRPVIAESRLDPDGLTPHLRIDGADTELASVARSERRERPRHALRRGRLHDAGGAGVGGELQLERRGRGIRQEGDPRLDLSDPDGLAAASILQPDLDDVRHVSPSPILRSGPS